MSPAPSMPQRTGARLVVGSARVTRLDGTEGRTLFPSPDFTHWPPFEMLAETSTIGSHAVEPHSHAREEVVNYVLSGRLMVYDENRRGHEVPNGSANLLTAARQQVHDVGPKAGARAHWISLVLRLPRDAAEPEESSQTGPTLPLPNPPAGLSISSVVGDSGPIRSVLGLDMQDVLFRETIETELPLEPPRTALIYVLGGRARVAKKELSVGGGLLSEGPTSLSISGDRGSRLIFASVGRRP